MTELISFPAYLLELPREMVDAEIPRARLWGQLARKNHHDIAPVDEAEQEAQKAWGERFRAVMDEGDAHDWIVREYDEDPSPAHIFTRKGTTVYDETVDEHVARVRPYIDGARRGLAGPTE